MPVVAICVQMFVLTVSVDCHADSNRQSHEPLTSIDLYAHHDALTSLMVTGTHRALVAVSKAPLRFLAVALHRLKLGNINLSDEGLDVVHLDALRIHVDHEAVANDHLHGAVLA